LLALGWLVSTAGCSSDPEPGDGDGATTSTTDTTTSTTSTTSTTDTTTSTTAPTTNSTTDIDLTTGIPDDTATTGDEPHVVGDGGTIPLTAEQIEAILAGECEGATSAAMPVPPVLELVVDVSQSMDTVAPGEPAIGGRSRWDLARPALLAALDKLPDAMAVGLQLFPTSNASTGGPGGPGGPFPGGSGGGSGFGTGGASGTGGATGAAAAECVTGDGRVPIAALGAAGSPQRQAIADAMNQTALYLGTPTHDAYHNALEEGLKPYTGPGDKFMLLMTDGAPTQLIGCGPLASSQMAVGLEPIIEEVTATATGGIKTFVIGSPGSEEGEAGDMRSFLSEVALQGQTGPMGCTVDGPTFCHFDMTAALDFSAALADGLASIAEQVVSTCTFAKPTDPSVDLNEIDVIVQLSSGASAVLEDGMGDCTEGWVWNANGEIELCPQTCATLQADPGGKVSVSFGCGDIIR